MATTKERLWEVFTGVVPLPEGADENTTFDSLGMDSLDMVELVQETEEEFDVVVDDDRVEKVVQGKLGDLIEYVEELQEQ